ncbi:interactor protein for cytohesin exchange factors 1 [Spea bombifrons]|uniref:interactor protein for cytohesin exchange factors 1 n=1 Tax=Spea bombifrons TaxID=233779 RepID=UPI002349F233|nr:interactor protein for cytohesin exchange factors 1 [Spea bombifrons]
MDSEANKEVSLRPKLNTKSRGSIFSMSRRRISCKDLGNADCQGWMYKKKEKSFLVNKWKKIWAVLKGSCLYWYTNQMAEKAEGFINLPDFIVNPASECKKKNAIKITHPQIKTFYFAAENREEMNKWLNKLGLAVIAQPVEQKKEEDCWSESEQDDQDATEISSSSCTAQHKPTDSTLQDSSYMSSDLSLAMNKSSHVIKSVSSTTEHEKQCDLHTVANLSGPEIERVILLQEKKEVNSIDGTLSCINSKDDTSENYSVSGSVQRTFKDNDDEMERLYKSLEQASLSPIGDRRPSSKKELRKSFIKRCKNPSINEKLHKIRTLNSTLKCKEHDLALINQLLEGGELTAVKYREWKDTNTLMFLGIYSPACDKDYTDVTREDPNISIAFGVQHES